MAGIQDPKCRLCGKSNKKKGNMSFIFDNKRELLEKIWMVTPVAVTISDHLPQHICNNCEFKLDIAVELVKTSVATDTKLKKELKLLQEKSSDCINIHGPAVCDLCNIKFEVMSKFDEHVKIHIKNKEKKENEETEIIIKAEDVKKEGEVVAESEDKRTKVNVCSNCGFIYTKSDVYEKHRALHEAQCSFCKCKYISQCLLFRHQCKAKQGIKKPVEKVVKRRKLDPDYKLDTDVESQEVDTVPTTKTVKKKSEKGFKRLNEFRCDDCGKVLTTKLSLMDHKRIHSGSKPYQCEACGDNFRTRANLIQHQTVHTGAKNYACEMCGKKFARKSFVRTHLRVHTGERPYVCQLCGYGFTQPGDLKRHNRLHLRSEFSPSKKTNKVPCK